MHILIICQAGAPVDHPGLSRHFELSDYLTYAGHQVTIVTGSSHYFSGDELSKDIQHGESSLSPRHIQLLTPDHGNRLLHRFMGMITFAWQVRFGRWHHQMDRKPDVIIGSSPPPIGVYAAMKLAKKWDIPFISETRDIWPESVMEYGGFSPYHPGILFLSHLEKQIYHNSLRAISVLPGAGQHINTKAGREIPFDWIPNGVDISKIEGRSGQTTPTSFDPDKFNIVYAGAHRRSNRLNIVLDAIGHLQQTHSDHNIMFHFIGDGHAKQKLMQRSARENLPVIFYDPIPKSDVFDFIGHGDAYIACIKADLAQKYGMSLNKLHEYLALGKPVIMASNAANTPVADCGGGIVVPPDDIPAISNAIYTMANLSVNKRMEIGKRGREYAAQHHSFDRLSKQFERVCQAAIDEYKRG